jgi:PAS domain S-box-containing protein
MSAAIITVNSKWEIDGANKMAEELFGVDINDFVGRNCNDLFCTEKHFSALCSLFLPVTAGQAITNYPILLKDEDSEQSKAYLTSIIPFPGEGDKASGAVICLRDASDRMLAYQLALDSVADGVFTVDEDFMVTSFNSAAEDITGWDRNEVIGKHCWDVFDSSICGDQCLLAESIREGKSIIDKSIFMHNKAGLTIPVSISSSPLLNYDGEVIGGVETFRDNTTSLKNDLILDSVADGVFTVDEDWKITSFNKAAEEITGWQQDEVLGKQCKDIFESSVCGEACVLRQSIIEKRSIVDQSIFIKKKNGSTIPISISASPLIDHKGLVIGGIETFRDTTLSIRNDMILDSIADGVFTVNRNWQITSFNKAAEDITGWKRKDAMGKSCSDIFHSSICGKNCAIAESLYSGASVANRSITIKDIEGKEIPISISAAPLADHEGNIIGGVETFRDLTAITSLRKQLTQSYSFKEIISKSPAMQRIFKIMPEIARSPSTVLILGESGTGKELVARAVFSASMRKDKPFVTVNCGALPETLLESELFGYKAGAFTDAKKDREGRFAAAEGGTIFLDEIGDIPQSLQVKLLRVLQEKIYEPLGSNTPVKADVRILAATNRDLQTLVKEGSFREDLYYRLNVVKIHLPPLRERKEDIPILIDHFIKLYSAQQGKDIVGIATAALNILMRYEYPGNIRELENIIEYAFILCEGGYIQPEHLPDPFTPGEIKLQSAGANIDVDTPPTLEEIEKQGIYLALERNKWKKMATCRELGISKDTLRRKIKSYELENPLDQKRN